MRAGDGQTYPVVDASFDHGATFPQSSPLLPPTYRDHGDRDFIAVAPDGAVYVTWDYGPSQSLVTIKCATGGSCYFTAGDFNIVVQKSTDNGKTWGGIVYVSPHFPVGGGLSGPVVVEPNGHIDVEYQAYATNPDTYALSSSGYSYFTSSSDGGKTWSAPVQLGPRKYTMSLGEWWIDGAIGIDSAGNLYATWDTQGKAKDIGWLTFSTNHGKTWSAPRQVSPDTANTGHIVEVAGAGKGSALVGWLTDSSPHGYAAYVRFFPIAHGWLTKPIRVSKQFGNRLIWPGDTFGISLLPARGQSKASRGGVQRTQRMPSLRGERRPCNRRG
jgi:hypothetical protein